MDDTNAAHLLVAKVRGTAPSAKSYFDKFSLLRRERSLYGTYLTVFERNRQIANRGGKPAPRMGASCATQLVDLRVPR